jgi:hypothetical protein
MPYRKKNILYFKCVRWSGRQCTGDRPTERCHEPLGRPSGTGEFGCTWRFSSGTVRYNPIILPFTVPFMRHVKVQATATTVVRTSIIQRTHVLVRNVS